MSNAFNKFAAKTFANKSKAHIFQPKSINLHFPNSIHPEFKSINLNNLSAVNFYIREDAEKSEFILILQMYSYNHVEAMDVAFFKTKEEAQDALDEIRVNMYVPMKSFVKWMSVLVLLGSLVCVAVYHKQILQSDAHPIVKSNDTAQKVTPSGNAPMFMAPPTPTMSPTNPSIAAPSVAGIVMPKSGNPADMPPPVSNGEIDAIISQLQQVKQLQDNMNKQKDNIQPQGQPQPQEAPQTAPQQTSPAEQFLKGLN